MEDHRLCDDCQEPLEDLNVHCGCQGCQEADRDCHASCEPFDPEACQGCKDAYLTEAETRFIAHEALGRH